MTRRIAWHMIGQDMFQLLALVTVPLWLPPAIIIFGAIIPLWERWTEAPP